MWPKKLEKNAIEHIGVGGEILEGSKKLLTLVRFSQTHFCVLKYFIEVSSLIYVKYNIWQWGMLR